MKQPAKARRRRLRRLKLGRVGAVAVIVLVGYLYYRPLASWMHTRGALAARTAQVQALEAQKTALEREVAQATSLAQLARSARRIGLVRPGERLFIVNGIPEWRRKHQQAR
jgi:cell division protein FtsB